MTDTVRVAIQAPVGLPRIGDRAPGFEAETTQGTLSLEDSKDSWLVLFSHPADFTPVCTTELIAFAKAHPQLRELNCELMGLSIDSVYAHIAWVRNIEENFDVRVVQALQATDQLELATPADWHPGDPMIVPPPKTQDLAAERVTAEGVECADWYFCRKAVSPHG